MNYKIRMNRFVFIALSFFITFIYCYVAYEWLCIGPRDLIIAIVLFNIIKWVGSKIEIK